MVTIAVIYLVLLWLVFSKFRLVRLSWVSGSIAAVIGLSIVATFAALLNTRVPAGRITIVARVVEVTPNISGEVIALPVKPNVPVKAGAVLFQIDPAPFRYSVTQAEAALVAAEQNSQVLKSNYEQQTANVNGLMAQYAYHQKRLRDLQVALAGGAETEFRIQDIQNQFDTTANQLQAARAAQHSAKLAVDSEIGGVNTSIIQTRAQLENAKWELAQTTVRAPADGMVTLMTLNVGDRARQFHSVMSFIVTSEITIIGMFSQNGFGAIQPGAKVALVFENEPGRLYQATIVDIPEGVGQGQAAVSGTLARTTAVGGASAFPAVISIPSDADQRNLRLGMSGTAIVFGKNAGAIGVVGWVLIWINSYTAYL